MEIWRAPFAASASAGYAYQESGSTVCVNFRKNRTTDLIVGGITATTKNMIYSASVTSNAGFAVGDILELVITGSNSVKYVSGQLDMSKA